MQKNSDQEKERGVQRKKTWFPFVGDLKRFYEGFMKVAFELGLEGYPAIYGLNRNIPLQEKSSIGWIYRNGNVKCNSSPVL